MILIITNEFDYTNSMNTGVIYAHAQCSTLDIEIKTLK